MPQLTVSNTSTSQIALGQYIGVLQPGETRTRDLTVFALQEALPRLVDGAAAGILSWSTANSSSPDDDAGEFITVASPVGGPPSGAAGGDLSGTYPNPAVAQLQGRAVSAGAPGANEVLTWDGAQWAPASPPGGGPVQPALQSAGPSVQNYSLTADSDDITLNAGVTLLRVSGAAGGFQFRGLTGGSDGRVLYVMSVGADTFDVQNEAGTSTAANRFLTPAGTPFFTININEVRIFIYDGVVNRWRITA